MLNPAGEFASTFAMHRARRKVHMSYLSDWETVIHGYGAATQTTGTFATVNRGDTKLPDPTTGTAVKRHAQHQSATVYRAIYKLQDLATGRAVEQRSTPSARKSQYKHTPNFTPTPPLLVSLFPTNRKRELYAMRKQAAHLSRPLRL